jgi:uncharacterized protein YhaN
LKLARLRLLAYGPFTNVELDLSAAGVHVVYGKNEAGKSTALRAITGLLYGIPRITPDAHVHRMPDLRVGATLLGEDGTVLDVIRRKGKDNTLLDREGRVVDEAALARLFGGVSQEQFLGMFGLDHESLRRAGEALRLGAGNVGESLFGAAMAGGELHRVLRELAAEAGSLFTPKGYTKPLNEALKAFAEAEKRTRDQSMSPDSMMQQMSGLAELRRDQAECESARQRLYLQRTKLERLARALPLLAKRRAATERRAAIGDVRLLAPEASLSRAEQVRLRDESERDVARLTAHLASLGERRDKLTLPESLVRFQEVPLDLAQRLGSYLRALTELPRLSAEIEQEEGEARTALRRAGRDVAIESIATSRIDAALQTTVHKLAVKDAQGREALLQTEQSLAEQRARREIVMRKLATVPAARDAATLKKAVSRAERDGQLEERFARARAECAVADERARAELGALGLTGRAFAEVASMAVPQVETVKRFAARFDAVEHDAREIAERRRAVTSRLDALTRDIDALERAGHVPSERDLAIARERRDARFRELSSLIAPSPARGKARSAADVRDALDAFETELRAADEMSDRLRREAERVSRLAALSADRESCQRELVAIAVRAAEIAEAKKQEGAAWHALWEPLGIEPHPPLEMQSWLLRHASFARTSDALRAADRAVEELRAAVERHTSALTALLAEHGAAGGDLRAEARRAKDASSTTLAELLDHASDVAARIESAALERRQLEQRLAEHDERIAALVAKQREHDAALAAVEKAWQEAVAPLGVGADASPERVTRTIELLEKAAHHVDRADGARRRAALLEREASAFRADVEHLAREHAPDLMGASIDRAAAEIVDRYHQGRSTLAARRELDRQLEETARSLEAQKKRHENAVAAIAEMMRAAAVDSLDALERAERASDEIRALDLEIARLDQELEALGGATSLATEAGDLDVDAVTVRLADVETELESLRENASTIDRRIGSAEAGLKDLEDPKAKAAEAAADAEAALARVRELSARYLRARTACFVLSREIEIYRQKNQGPILSRASDLFRRLTLQSFAGLRTDYDDSDKPVLCGVRAGGSDVGVEAMSDGTRDQLYLALRVATLERYAERGNPMPIVLDDILVHFDDDRARAALELIGELSDRMQVLFFTHHARLVELARETIGAPKLAVHELHEREARHGSVGGVASALLGSARK